ncbi:MAG TPA: alanyl-tRNA editing protein [Gemmatimonadaceae bacterium]|nr:alanyl-tRNA editing protein [Gemmatimonadaceae bacterium]
MTTRLYYSDSYRTEFDARVVERADDGRRVYLDHTAFYPTSGGQPHDAGTLGAARVRDVIDEGARIAHVLDTPLNEGAVTGRIDWPRRFDHMQQHTGQHLLSAVVADLFGWATVSVHFGADVSTLDVDVPSITPEHAARAEQRANEIVFENRLVTVSYEDAATATGLRKASDRDGTLRIVSIADLDRSACGGTHVRATGEIGAILVGKPDKVRQSARLEFVCGMRAVHRARADYDALSRLAQSLSAAPQEVADLVARQTVRLKDAESRLRQLDTELAARIARERYDAAQPDDAGVRRVVERRAAGSLDELRPLALATMCLPRAVFVGAVDSPAVSLLLAASEDSGLDAGRALKAALADGGGRGGGSARLAQGTLPSREALDRALASIGGVR